MVDPKSQNEINPNILPWTRWAERAWNTYVKVPLPRRGSCSGNHWKKQRLGDPHGPDKYVELDALSAPLLNEIMARAESPDCEILDLGCNSGRNLNALFERGMRKLHGVDVQREAFDSMERNFPEMKAKSTLHIRSFQDFLPRIRDKRYEIIFSEAAVEFVPPSLPIVKHLARLARKAVILMVAEGGHSYPRLWETEFTRQGFFLTKLLRPVLPGNQCSLMVFVDGRSRE